MATTSQHPLPSGYTPRPVRFLELWRPGEWTVKVYGISAKGERPDPDLVSTGKELAVRQLPVPAAAGNRYGVGIVIVHEGEDGNYVLVNWWMGENMLHNHVYHASRTGTRPGDFRDVTPTGLTACVWELHVLHFERTAWIRSVLAREGGPNLEEYLMQRFQGTV